MFLGISIRKAEIALIGTVINGGRLPDVTPEDFESKDTQEVFDAIQRMKNEKKKIDIITLDGETSGIHTDLIVEAEGLGYLTTMAKQYTDIVKENSARRRVLEIVRSLTDDMIDTSVDIDLSVENARKQLAGIGNNKRHPWLNATELANVTMSYLERLSTGEIKPVPTGIFGLDYTIGGLYPGELTIIGAKPGTGKTVMGMVIAINAARAGRKVAIMNLEMLEEQYGSRMVSNVGQYDAMKIRKGEYKEDWSTIANALNEISQLPITTMFSSRYVEDLISAVKENGDVELLVVDYIQLVRTKQKLESERLRMAYISLALKELAVELRIPIIVMSQLRRTENDDKMPSMRDLRETSNLESDADSIILLHEPRDADDRTVRKEDKQSFDGWKQQGMKYICINVEKQRQGSTGLIPILFDASKMRYLGIERNVRK